MSTISVTGTDLEADYLAIAYHNLSDVEINIYADSDLIKSYTPASDAPFIVALVDAGDPPIIADEWVIEFDTSDDVQIAVLKLGLLLNTLLLSTNL